MEISKTDNYYMIKIYGDYGEDTLGPYPDQDTALKMVNLYCNPDNVGNIKIRHIVDMTLQKKEEEMILKRWRENATSLNL